MHRGLSRIVALAALLIVPLTAANQNIARNGSMESGAGPHGIDPQVADKWTEFGTNVERSDTVNLVPAGGGFALKAFGDGTTTNVGAYQVVTGISAGQSVSASVSIYSPNFDKLGGSGQAGLVLEFLNLFGGLISSQSTYPFDVSSPADTWVPAALGPFTAPSGTTQVRVTCRLQWSGSISGAAYWDGASLTVNGGANKLLNGDFETAGASGGQSPVGIDQWQGFNDQEKSSDFARSGQFSLKLGTTQAYSGLYQDMGVLNAGDHVFLLAYIYNPSSNPMTGNTRVGIKLEFQSNTTAPPPVENLAFTPANPQNTWTLVTLSQVVPAGINIARLDAIWVGDGGTTGEADFDSAFAERSTQPGVNQLLNAGFESGGGGANGIDNWTEFYSLGVSECRKSCFTVPAKDGFCTARGTGPAVAGLYQEVAVTPGETITFSTFIYSPSFNPIGGTGKAGVKIEWFVGGIPAQVDIGDPCTSTNTLGPCAATNTWLPVYIDYTMPAGTSAVGRFTNIIEKGSALSGAAYFDGCEAVVLNRFNGADADADNDEDMADFAGLQRAFRGSGVVPTQWPWNVYDSDRDNDVDLTDSEFFLTRFTNPL